MVREFEDWPAVHKISYLQRRIIVWSILYYQWDESIVTDAYYNEKARQLFKLQQSTQASDRIHSTYWYVMHDFDPSTGYDLFAKLNRADKDYLSKIANMVLQQYKNR